MRSIYGRYIYQTRNKALPQRLQEEIHLEDHAPLRVVQPGKDFTTGDGICFQIHHRLDHQNEPIVTDKFFHAGLQFLIQCILRSGKRAGLVWGCIRSLVALTQQHCRNDHDQQTNDNKFHHSHFLLNFCNKKTAYLCFVLPFERE